MFTARTAELVSATPPMGIVPSLLTLLPQLLVIQFAAQVVWFGAFLAAAATSRMRRMRGAITNTLLASTELTRTLSGRTAAVTSAFQSGDTLPNSFRRDLTALSVVATIAVFALRNSRAVLYATLTVAAMKNALMKLAKIMLTHPTKTPL